LIIKILRLLPKVKQKVPQCGIPFWVKEYRRHMTLVFRPATTAGRIPAEKITYFQIQDPNGFACFDR
jgi:hypothetical protein